MQQREARNKLMRRCTCKRASVISLNINCSRINNISHMTRHLRPDTQELIVPNFRIRQPSSVPGLVIITIIPTSIRDVDEVVECGDREDGVSPCCEWKNDRGFAGCGWFDALFVDAVVGDESEWGMWNGAVTCSCVRPNKKRLKLADRSVK